jgi:hypothetical protein
MKPATPPSVPDEVAGLLERLGDLFGTTRKPYWAWLAIRACRDSNSGWPLWLQSHQREYLEGFSDRALSRRASGADTGRAAAPYVLGLGARGPEHPFRGLLEHFAVERLAVAFCCRIFRGEEPTSALQGAGEDVGRSRGDRALRRKIVAYFGVTAAPRDNEGWRRVIVPWLLKHWVYPVLHPELPPLWEMISEYLRLFPTRSITLTGDGFAADATPNPVAARAFAWAGDVWSNRPSPGQVLVPDYVLEFE